MLKLYTRTTTKMMIKYQIIYIHLADIRLLPCVDPHVRDQLVLGVERFVGTGAVLQ